MKLAVLLLLAVSLATAQDQKAQKPTTLKAVLLEQLKTTHNVKDWFVPANVAVEGLTADQANWKDKSGNHSVGQLAYHLVFWNSARARKIQRRAREQIQRRQRRNIRQLRRPEMGRHRQATRRRHDRMGKSRRMRRRRKIKEWASDIAHIGTHNAYHIGQIVYVRKEQGTWNPEKGVK